MSETVTPSNDTADPVPSWSNDTLASMLYVFANDHPVPKVQEAMEEAARRLRSVNPSLAPVLSIGNCVGCGIETFHRYDGAYLCVQCPPPNANAAATPTGQR